MKPNTSTVFFPRMTSPEAPYALAVDDDPLVLLLVCAILEDAGYRSFQAGSVSAALGILAEKGSLVTLLFTDVEMPGEGNGFDLARQVADQWPHIDIVVASGRVAPETDELPAKALFLDKPFSADVVQDHLRRLVPNDRRPAPQEI